MSSNFVMATATRDELTEIVQMTIEEAHWRASYKIVDAWWALDPAGFFIGRVDGMLVSQICAIRYDDSYGFMGLYLVRESHRGKRFGISLARHAIRHLAGCNIGVSAELDRIADYARSGFVLTSDDLIFLGVAARCPTVSSLIVHYDDSMLDAVAEYDRRCFPAARRGYLARLFQMEDCVVYVYREAGELRGYVTVYPVHDAWTVAPCFADTAEIARQLIRAAVNSVPKGGLIEMNVQCENPDAQALVAGMTEYQMKVDLRLGRMYTKGVPMTDSSKVWLVMSFFIG
jgi:ribosomal protein S18 acetylase RimI-like enzyme